MKFEVRWNVELTDFYKHGSTVEYTKEEVRFENKMLSPGATIVTWKSNPSYQGQRGWLELPLLERGKRYHVKLEATSSPKPFLLLKVEFYNRAEDSIGLHLIQNHEGAFTYPKEAYSYTMTLLNNGIEELCFQKITLQSYDERGDALD